MSDHAITSSRSVDTHVSFDWLHNSPLIQLLPSKHYGPKICRTTPVDHAEAHQVCLIDCFSYGFTQGFLSSDKLRVASYDEKADAIQEGGADRPVSWYSNTANCAVRRSSHDSLTSRTLLGPHPLPSVHRSMLMPVDSMLPPRSSQSKVHIARHYCPTFLSVQPSGDERQCISHNTINT